MKHIYTAVIFQCIVKLGISQATPGIEWQDNYGGSETEYPHSLKLTTDGGYIMAGQTFSLDGDVSDSSQAGDVWIIKVDVNGIKEWDRVLGGKKQDGAYAIELTDDGGYIVAGFAYSNNGDITGHHGSNLYADVWIVKIDASGNLTWQKSFGGTNNDFAYDIKQTSDGGYIIAGYTTSSNGDVSGLHSTGYTDIWVIKITATGTISWQKCYGGSFNDEAHSLVYTEDGNYVIAGYTNSNDGDVTGHHAGNDMFIIKINASGLLLWQRCIGGSETDEAESVISTPDGGYLVAGKTSSDDGDIVLNTRPGNADFWLVKLDVSGNTEWTNLLGGTDSDYPASVTNYYDGGYVIAGSTESDDGDVPSDGSYLNSDFDLWLTKVDDAGSLQWQKRMFHQPRSEYGRSIIQTPDSGLAVLSQAYIPISEHMSRGDFNLIKLTAGLEFFADSDNDGFGDTLVSVIDFEMPFDYTENSDDCNDANNTIYPGAPELCNTIDDNCNGDADEWIYDTWFMDADGDGYGNPDDSVTACTPPGGVLNNTDCNDSDPEINPGSIEICNGIDDNCDGIAENFTPVLDGIFTYGGSYTDVLHEISPTSDGGFIAAGNSQSKDGDISDHHGSALRFDSWLGKINSSGELEWEKSIGGTDHDYASSVKQTVDGGYIVLGTAYSTDGDLSGITGNQGFWIYKTDVAGNIEWQKLMGGSGTEIPAYVDQAVDGNYYVLSNTNSTDGDVSGLHVYVSFFDYWVVKLDVAGNLLWQKCLGGTGSEQSREIKATSDGGCIVLGSSSSNDGDVSGNHGGSDWWVVKLNSAGTIEWQKSLGGSESDYPGSVIQTAEGGYIICGSSSSNNGNVTGNHGSSDVWITKLGASGNVIWKKCYGGSSGEGGNSIYQTFDGGYIVHLQSSSFDGDFPDNDIGGVRDMWLMKIDLSGSIVWKKHFEGSDSESDNNVIQLKDSSYAFIIDYDGLLNEEFTFGLLQSDYLRFYADTDDDGYGNLENDTIAMIQPCGYVANNTDCDDTDPLVNILIAAITPSGSTTFCSGSSVILNAITGTGYTYKWYKNGILVPPATSSSMTITKPGNYKVEISNGTCSDISDEITITVNPKPSATITNVDITNDLCFDSSIKLKANNGAGFSWQWYKGATAIAGATGNIYFATAPGNYKVKITNSSGCEKLSSAYTIIKTCKLNDEENSISLNIYPNPSNGNFTIQLQELDAGHAFISIKNILGEEIYVSQINNTLELNYTVSLNKMMSNGIYFVEIRTANKVFAQRIMIAV